MKSHKGAALTAAAAAIGLIIWISQSGMGGMPSSDDAGRVAQTARVSEPQPGSQGADRDGVLKLLKDFDTFIARVRAGDDTLSDSDRANMAARLEFAVEFSPQQRAALKKVLQDSFGNGNVTAMTELERAFSTSELGGRALIDVYTDIVDRGGELDYYALQNVAMFQGAIDQDRRERLIEHSFKHLQKYEKFENYNGAMQFLSSAAMSGAEVSDADRRMAISLIESKLYGADGDHAQYFAAQNLYKLMPAEVAANHAISVVRQRPTFPVARATLEAIVYGRMAVNPDLVDILAQLASQPGMPQNQSSSLRNLLAQLPPPAAQLAGGR